MNVSKYIEAAKNIKIGDVVKHQGIQCVITAININYAILNEDEKCIYLSLLDTQECRWFRDNVLIYDVEFAK